MEIIKPDLKKAVKAIKEGKVLVCPTDTVYGLICAANNKKAVDRLFKIKKRSRNKPIPIFVKDIKMAKRFAYINRNQEDFLKKIWPGKVTAVLKSKKKIKTIGIRIPDYRFILSLIKKSFPLAESSANISGKPASTKIKEVIKQFKNQKYQPDLVIDAGNLLPSKPSTVIDLTIWPPKILRY
jgi:L-threonylcarbamoyladenylate synthase